MSDEGTRGPVRLGPWFEAPPTRPSLTPDRVVQVAHELVHDGGGEALNIRSLAERLSVGTSAIYRRFERKEHLLLAVTDLVLSGVAIDAVPVGGEWTERIRELSLRIRATLLDHPHVHPIIDTHLLATPAAVRIGERGLEILGRAGFTGGGLVDAYNAWIGYVLGFSVIEGQLTPLPSERDRLREWVRGYFQSVDPIDLPTVAGVAEELQNRGFAFRWDAAPLGRGGSSFRVGLDSLLTGLDATRGIDV